MIDLQIKKIILHIHELKKQLKPDDYYKLLQRISMVCNAEYNEQPKLIEYKAE